MARPLRLEYPGALWHVMNRGVERRTIFLDERDRQTFLALLERSVVKSRWRLHAYVLMSNHYHLLLQTPETTLSRGMKDLDGDHASIFNKRHSRAGHLFQGRFGSHLVDSDSYLLELSRYIVLNPVRARMISAPEEWRWSSYRATAGLTASPAWLEPEPILERFHPLDAQLARGLYREFVAAGIGQTVSPWTNLVAQAFLGGAAFLEEMEERVRERACSSEHPREQRRFRAQTIDGVQSAIAATGADAWPPGASSLSRAAFGVTAARHTSATNAEIGRRLGITGQAVGKLLRSSQRRATIDRSLAELIREVEDCLLSATQHRFRVST